MLGALIVLLIASVLDIESRKLHIFLNGALGAFIGLTFYLINVSSGCSPIDNQCSNTIAPSKSGSL